MKFYTILIAMPLAISCSTQSGSTAKEEQTPKTSISTTEVKETTTQKVLNPNFATQEELVAIEGVSNELALSIIEARPHLDPIAFIELLKLSIADKLLHPALQQLFLPMNLNTTEEADFQYVPEVGKKIAHEFEEYRPYTSIEQFRREIGKYVDEAQVSRFEKYVFVPKNLNTASKKELLTIPGMGKKCCMSLKSTDLMKT